MKTTEDDQSGQTIDQTNIILKSGFSNKIIAFGSQSANRENFRNIGRRVKASVKLVFVKEVLQIFHFLKIELQQYFESRTTDTQRLNP